MRDFTEARVETIGCGQFFRQDTGSRECLLRIAVRHPDRRAMGLVSREWASSGTSMAQGQCGGGGWFGVRSVVSAFMCLVPKRGVTAVVGAFGRDTPITVPTEGGFAKPATVRPVPAARPSGNTVRVALLDVCWARSGDKGDYANIGLIARRPEYLPWLREQVTVARVRELFAHNCKGEVERYDLPGTASMNFVLKHALGGGGTSSLHSDQLAKTYGGVLLAMEVDSPVDVATTHRLLNHRGSTHSAAVPATCPLAKL